MNALVQQPKYHAQLPAFLQDPTLFASSQAAVAGIGGGSPPMISIRQAKFRLVGSDGVEQMVNQFHLDVIVLDGNPHVSKMYYAGAYDPNATDAKPPTCRSDNGTAPSVDAASPQAPTCAECQWGAWGSKVTDAGTKVKACSDSKKLAVVLAADTPVIVNGAAGVAKAYEQVFLLRVPAASMVNWKTYGKSILDRGVPLQGVISRVQFDPATNYPALLFQAADFVQDEQVFRALMAKCGTSEVIDAIGSDDQPRAAAPALPGPAPAFMATVPSALQSAPAPVQQAPIQQIASPQPTAQPAPPIAPVQVAPQEPQFAPVPAAAPSAQRQRGRPRATPPDALSAPGPVVMTPGPLQNAPTGVIGAASAGHAPQAGVIVTPQPTDQSLDALLEAALGT